MSNHLELLSAEEAARREIPWPDVYFTPGYGSAVEATDGGAWELALWQPGPIVFPYLRRPVDPALGAAGAGRFDIISPYGYAGTWAPPDLPQGEWRAFRSALRAALRQAGAVAEFQRIGGLVPGRDPLLAADPELSGRHYQDTIAIDLARGYDACWEAAESRSRTKTRKARKRGYAWSCRPAQPEDVRPGSSFRALYDGTMRRVEADPYYLFPDLYYERLQAFLGPRLLVLEVRAPDGRIGVSGLAMDWRPLLHLHLVGSETWATSDGAGNLLYDGIIRWGAEQGCFERLHVGGGQSPDDRLFYFKRGFGGEPVPMWLARSVLDPEAYAALLEARAAATGRAVGELEASGYFPAYRA